MSDTQPDNATPILQINNRSIALPEGADRKYAVEEVSLTVNRGEVLCVVGESGSGKSVMTSAIMADIAPRLKVVKGEVLYNGNNVLEFSDAELTTCAVRLSMIYQEPMAALNPALKIGAQVDEVF